jgi:hypothetical protein
VADFRRFCKKYPQQILLDEKERARGVTDKSLTQRARSFSQPPYPLRKPENRAAI